MDQSWERFFYLDYKLQLPSSIFYEARPTTVFAMLHYYSESIVRIVRLETPVNNHNAAYLTLRRIEKRVLKENDCVEHIDFNKDQSEAELIDWLFSPPRSPNGFIYIVPKRGDVMGRNIDQFPGYIYNVEIKRHQIMKSLPAPKCYGHVVNCRGQIYFLANPDSYYPPGYPTFEVYDLETGRWEPLKSFPQNFDRSFGDIQATAVWDDTIVYNLDGAFEFWAYNVTENEWYLVEVIDDAAKPKHRRDNRSYTIHGEAVVRENTIFALTSLSPDTILELSIERNAIDGDCAYKCSLVSEIFVPGLQPVGLNDEDTCVWSRHLVPLGDDNFCLVQSCLYFMNKEFQPIQLTSIKLVEKEGEKSMTVIGSCLYEVFNEIDGPGGTFEVALCFSLFDLYRDGQFRKDKEYIPKSLRATMWRRTDEGHSTCVCNLPPETTKVKLKKKLKKFGLIKSAWISKANIQTGKCFAIVVFESAVSKHRAIEESTIIIRGGCAVIEECSMEKIGQMEYERWQARLRAEYEKDKRKPGWIMFVSETGERSLQLNASLKWEVKDDEEW